MSEHGIGIAERLCIKYGMFQNHDDGQIIIWPEVAAAINEALELAAKEVETYMPPGETPIVCSRKELARAIRALKSGTPEHTEVQE